LLSPIEIALTNKELLENTMANINTFLITCHNEWRSDKSNSVSAEEISFKAEAFHNHFT